MVHRIAFGGKQFIRQWIAPLGNNPPPVRVTSFRGSTFISMYLLKIPATEIVARGLLGQGQDI